MRMTKLFLSVFLFTVAFSGIAYSQPVEVSIDSISRDYKIEGRVIGLTEEARKGHKVVVFVRTDKWYIHPFAQGGDGKSWASIAPGGVWKISTVKREYPASSVAVLVVKSGDNVPSSISDIAGIPHVAIYVKELEGTEDYNKL